MKIVCPQCRNEADLPAGAVNRARKVGATIYCGRVCSGLARRKPKTVEQKKAEKAEYDRWRRLIHWKRIKAEKAAYFQRTYDPVVAAVARKARMPRHVEYCQRPEYVEWKREYDRQYRAREYGEFAEAYLLLLDVDREVRGRMSDYDIRMANGTLNKSLRRKRGHVY